MEQKLELKDLQLVEVKETMEGQKEMYNSMLKALQNQSETSTYEQQLKAIKEMQKKQDSEVNEVRVKYEKQITDLKERINMQEFNEKSLKSQLKQDKNNFKEDLREKEKTINELQLKIQKISSEKDRSLEKMRNEIENMEERHLNFINNMEGNNSGDLEKLKDEYESKLMDIKYLNEQENLSLKGQIRKLEEEVMILREEEQSYQLNRDSEFESERVKVLDIRLSEINDKFADDMLATEKEVAKLRRETDEKDSKIESLNVSIERLKNQMITRLEEKDHKYSKLKEKYNEKCSDLTTSHKKIKDTLNLKKRISDLKVKNSKLERIKRDLKDQLKARENELEAERASKQKAIYQERRKNKLKGETLSKLRKERDLQNIELESIKKENMETSMNESRYYSPRPLRRRGAQNEDLLSPEHNTNYTSGKVNMESSSKSRLDYSVNMNESVSYLKKSNNKRKMKSSSPNRTKMIIATHKIRVGGLGRKASPRRMIQISTEQVNMYDGAHAH